MRKFIYRGFGAAVIVVFAVASVFGEALPFQSAKPVWPRGRENRMNDFVEFRATFRCDCDEAPILRIAASTVYRVRLNGQFAGYGPARAAKGFFRVDEWPLAVSRECENTISIEVSAYNCNTFIYAEWPAFLQAEVVSGGRVLAMTGRDIAAYETRRVTKCSRYSFQRGFGEAYRLAPDDACMPLPLDEQPAVPLLERIAALPDFPVTRIGAAVSGSRVIRREKYTYLPENFVDNPGKHFKLYPVDELEVNIWRELQSLWTSSVVPVAADGRGMSVSGNYGLVFDVGFDETGFPGLTVNCVKPGRLWMAFDEILLSDGKVNPVRYSVANGVVWDLQPGSYRLETFEPYTFRYMHVFADGGAFELADPFVRGYKNRDAKRARFSSSDPAIDRIFAAARETFAQNAVDVFTDCPGRERAGWLCDSFFTARSALLFTGSTDLERLFMQNYLLPKSFPDIPDGALPMCYPADHPGGVFIPNWCMWFVIELDEYLRRSGDRATVDALRPRMEKLISYLKTFRNKDGLLERLPSWVFLEWSEANNLVQDVNYPSNMTWAEVLDCMDRLYDMPELSAEAKAVRETVRSQSWTGEWFCDNAVRQPDGTLKLSGKCTETCQYYAFMFGTATPETHPVLWRTLLEDFGPKRRESKMYPQIYPSNAFIGNFMRLELLSRAGMGRRLLEETKGYFSYMAERTGTLWEKNSPSASCNHGFASHVAVFYLKNVLGVESVDARAKTVAVNMTDVPLEYCEATLPVPGGEVTYGWKGVPHKEHFSAPAGWSLVKKEVVK